MLLIPGRNLLFYETLNPQVEALHRQINQQKALPRTLLLYVV